MLSKITTWAAVMFMVTSLTLAILSARDSGRGASVLDGVESIPATAPAETGEGGAPATLGDEEGDAPAGLPPLEDEGGAPAGAEDLPVDDEPSGN